MANLASSGRGLSQKSAVAAPQFLKDAQSKGNETRPGKHVLKASTNLPTSIGSMPELSPTAAKYPFRPEPEELKPVLDALMMAVMRRVRAEGFLLSNDEQRSAAAAGAATARPDWDEVFGTEPLAYQAFVEVFRSRLKMPLLEAPEPPLQFIWASLDGGKSGTVSARAAAAFVAARLSLARARGKAASRARAPRVSLPSVANRSPPLDREGDVQRCIDRCVLVLGTQLLALGKVKTNGAIDWQRVCGKFDWTVKELCGAVRENLRLSHRECPDGDLRAVFDKLDDDRCGSVSRTDFVAFCKKRYKEALAASPDAKQPKAVKAHLQPFSDDVKTASPSSTASEDPAESHPYDAARRSAAAGSVTDAEIGEIVDALVTAIASRAVEMGTVKKTRNADGSERIDWQRVFAKYDRDKGDFEDMVYKLGLNLDKLKYPEWHTQFLWDLLDADRQGSITYVEFEAFMAPRLRRLRRAEAEGSSEFSLVSPASGRATTAERQAMTVFTACGSLGPELSSVVDMELAQLADGTYDGGEGTRIPKKRLSMTFDNVHAAEASGGLSLMTATAPKKAAEPPTTMFGRPRRRPSGAAKNKVAGTAAADGATPVLAETLRAKLAPSVAAGVQAGAADGGIGGDVASVCLAEGGLSTATQLVDGARVPGAAGGAVYFVFMKPTTASAGRERVFIVKVDPTAFDAQAEFFANRLARELGVRTPHVRLLRRGDAGGAEVGKEWGGLVAALAKRSKGDGAAASLGAEMRQASCALLIEYVPAHRAQPVDLTSASDAALAGMAFDVGRIFVLDLLLRNPARLALDVLNWKGNNSKMLRRESDGSLLAVDNYVPRSVPALIDALDARSYRGVVGDALSGGHRGAVLFEQLCSALGTNSGTTGGGIGAECARRAAVPFAEGVSTGIGLALELGEVLGTMRKALDESFEAFFASARDARAAGAPELEREQSVRLRQLRNEAAMAAARRSGGEQGAADAPVDVATLIEQWSAKLGDAGESIAQSMLLRASESGTSVGGAADLVRATGFIDLGAPDVFAGAFELKLRLRVLTDRASLLGDALHQYQVQPPRSADSAGGREAAVGGAVEGGGEAATGIEAAAGGAADIGDADAEVGADADAEVGAQAAAPAEVGAAAAAAAVGPNSPDYCGEPDETAGDQFAFVRSRMMDGIPDDIPGAPANTMASTGLSDKLSEFNDTISASPGAADDLMAATLQGSTDEYDLVVEWSGDVDEVKALVGSGSPGAATPPTPSGAAADAE